MNTTPSINETSRIDTSKYTPLNHDVFKLISKEERALDVVEETSALYCSTGCLVRNRIYNVKTMVIHHQDTVFIPDTYIHETFSHDKKLVRRYIKQSSNAPHVPNTTK